MTARFVVILIIGFLISANAQENLRSQALNLTLEYRLSELPAEAAEEGQALLERFRTLQAQFDTRSELFLSAYVAALEAGSPPETARAEAQLAARAGGDLRPEMRRLLQDFRQFTRDYPEAFPPPGAPRRYMRFLRPGSNR